MYGHPAYVVDHARALAHSPRAFSRWFWKTSRQAGLFPEQAPPSPAPSVQLMEQAGGLYSSVAVSSTTATNSHKWEI